MTEIYKAELKREEPIEGVSMLFELAGNDRERIYIMDNDEVCVSSNSLSKLFLNKKHLNKGVK